MYYVAVGNILVNETTRQKREIGERMKHRRDYLGMTQQEVADYLDIDRVTYTQYEIGKNQIPSVLLPRLAKMFRVSAGYFFGEVDPSEVEEDEFLKFYNGRPPEQKAQARRVLLALFGAQDEEAKQEEPLTHGKKAE